MTQELPSFARAFEQLVAAVCAHREELRVRFSGGRTAVFVVVPHRADFGMVCGKAGSNHRSLTVIASAMAAKAGHADAKVLLEEPETGERVAKARSPFVPNPQWDHAELEQLVLLTAAELFDGRLVASFDRLSQADTRLTLRTDLSDGVPPGLEQALGQIFGAVAAAGGMRLTFELDDL